jgi:lipopolysaccharide biosynthesis regulator YciM
MDVPDQSRKMYLGLLLLFLGWCLTGTSVSVAESSMQSVQAPLVRAKVYLAAGDYRRAVEACQMNIDQSPSVESYVYLIYVYHALDGYLEWLSKRDEWVKVGQLSLSMVNRGTMDLVDPSDLLARMAKELLHEGIRQQYDLVAGMANRLDRTRADEIWLEMKAWKKTHPENWWAGVPEQWQWEGGATR